MTKKIELTELKETSVDNEYDLFICCCSFEKRCLSVPQNLSTHKIDNSLIVYNEEILEYINTNLSLLKDYVLANGKLISIHQSDPLYTADSIKNALLEYRDKSTRKVHRILLDITTFTHETLLILLKLIQILFPDSNIICAYANALDYDAPNNKNEKWLSKGISEIRSVLGYAGMFMPAQKTHLIIVVGYEYERAISIINALEPSSISLGFGRSNNATTQKNIDANEHYMELVSEVASNYSNIDTFEVMCNDPYQTRDELTKIIKSHSDKNILISPLNNKISTIGVAFATFENENVRVCYAPALTYNYENYSEPGESCYLFDITEAMKQR